MSCKLIVTKEAEADILNGYLSYEEKQEGIGLRFMDEIEQAFDRISHNPFLYQEVEADIRRAVTHTFPLPCLLSFRRGDRTNTRGYPWLSGTLPISMSGLAPNDRFETTAHLRFSTLQPGRFSRL